MASVVPFLFGVADRTALPGTVLVRLLTEVGVSESAARSALARMRTDGSLRSVRHGRRTDYELSGLVEAAFRRARSAGNPQLAEPQDSSPAWTGEFHGLLFTIAEADRPHRDRLRHAARLAGYAPLRPGLMIATADGWHALAELVSGLPTGATVYPLTLVLSPDDARAAAAEAWNLAEVAADTELLITRLAEAVDQDRVARPGPDALSQYLELALPAYSFFVGIPRLPDALLPSEWPLTRLVAALAAVRAHLGLAVEAYVAEVLAST